jgi:hypothetical protein
MFLLVNGAEGLVMRLVFKEIKVLDYALMQACLTETISTFEE